jgi:hypothetical protein
MVLIDQGYRSIKMMGIVELRKSLFTLILALMALAAADDAMESV